MGEGTAAGSDPAYQQAAHHIFAEANIIGCGSAEDRSGTESTMGQDQGTTSEKSCVKFYRIFSIKPFCNKLARDFCE